MAKKSRARGVSSDGEKLLSFRKARGWSQESAAHKAGVSDKVIRKAEAGGRIDASSLAALVKLYSSEEAAVGLADLMATPSPSDSEDEDIALLVKWLDACWARRSPERVRILAAGEIRLHCEAGTLHGQSDILSRLERIWEAFSHFQCAIKQTSVSGVKTACIWQLSMEHTGAWHGIEPTGNRITILANTMARIHLGEIVECWEYWDPRAIYRELLKRSEDFDQAS